ncbi:MAG: UvrD-helicase domain-containing protein [Rikenellaceae bacterium]|nr:UvrD-helicase domain-containing protein [Rikenellaceae bacterium]
MGEVKIYNASAGSGKTYSLAYEYVRNVIESPVLYRHILAVTFTNKATEEMKSRILSEINKLANGERTGYLRDLGRELGLSEEAIRSRATEARTYILHDYSHFAVLTIDKFFQRIIRSFIKELGIELNFNLELQTDTLLSEATDALIERISSDDKLRRWIFELVEERIDGNAAWNIKKNIEEIGTEIFREEYKAAPVALDRDRLREIVHRASAQAAEIEKRMGELARRATEIIDGAGLALGDFTGGSRSGVGYFYRVAAGEIGPYSKTTANLLEAESWHPKKGANNAGVEAVTPALRSLLGELCGIYDDNYRFLNSCRLLAGGLRDFALLADLARQVETLCREQNLMHISDTNDTLARLIAGNNDTPFIFEKVGNYYHRFMIDEFQDTSVKQWENFIPLLHNTLSEEPGTPVLLVGDVKQAIYRWRGGDWRILSSEVARRLATRPPRPLTTNWRSLPAVVEFNNEVIGSIVDADNAALDALTDKGLEQGDIGRPMHRQLHGALAAAYRDFRQECARDQQPGYVTLTTYPRRPGEPVVPPVVERIKALQDQGYAAGDIAILVRRNTEGSRIAQLLLEHKNSGADPGYCFDVVSSDSLQVGSADICSLVVACLRLAVNSDNTIARALFNRWFDRPFDAPLSPEDDRLFRHLRLLSPQEAFERIVLAFGLGDRERDVAYLQALHQQIVNFCTNSVADIPLFLKAWDDHGHKQPINIPPSRSAITVTTIHKSKGLAYPAVIIPFCNWSMTPVLNPTLWSSCEGTPFQELGRAPVRYEQKTAESLFSERYYQETVMSHIDNVNTLYVALTRAQNELHIMIPLQSRQRSGIHDLLLAALSGDAASGQARAGASLKGTYAEEPDREIARYAFGTPTRMTSGKTDPAEPLTRYATGETAGRVKLRLPSQRYTDEQESTPALSPRNFGILMHRAFEQSETREDIMRSVTLMERQSLLSPHEGALLREKIEAAFTNPLIRNWFEGDWDQVRNENEIISPQIHRPDRVMTKATRAVVVDYKFGMAHRTQHAAQIRAYMRLLQEMGYTEVEGYLWYVQLDDIEPVAV